MLQITRQTRAQLWGADWAIQRPRKRTQSMARTLHELPGLYRVGHWDCSLQEKLRKYSQRGVWSVDCEVWTVKCGVWSAKWEGSSGKWEVWTVKCEVWSVKFKFGVRRAQCEVWSVRFGVWRQQREVRSVKCGVRSVECEVWSFEREECSVKCGVRSVECEDFALSLAEKIKRLSREGHGRDRLASNYRSFMFGKLPPPACPGLCYYSILSYLILYYKARGHRGPGVGDQWRHLPGTRANVPAGLWWRTAAHISRSWWHPQSLIYIYTRTCN